jgi:3-oxoacyl-[acyl-carrier protein] reductase
MKKTALVTGGSRGIGLGIARELAMAGFDLGINGIREEGKAQAALDELRSLGAEVIYTRGDISNAENRLSIFKQMIQCYGQINVLVNNAGVAPAERMDLLEATEESYDRVLGINLKGPYFFTQLIARHMVEQKSHEPGFRATIINVSSISATVASTNRGEYCISKAGLTMASRLWSVRLGEYEIPVYEIRPGIIETDMTSGVKEKYDDLIADGLCVQKRWGLPEDVGKVAASMATGSMPYSTGQAVLVDGGLTIPRL